MKSLFLLKPLQKKNFKVKHEIIVEIDHLRKTAKWELDYNYQSLHTHSCTSVLSLNTRNLETYIINVLNDYDLMDSEILCLQERHLKQDMLNKSSKPSIAYQAIKNMDLSYASNKT